VRFFVSFFVQINILLHYKDNVSMLGIFISFSRSISRKIARSTSGKRAQNSIDDKRVPWRISWPLAR